VKLLKPLFYTVIDYHIIPYGTEKKIMRYYEQLFDMDDINQQQMMFNYMQTIFILCERYLSTAADLRPGKTIFIQKK
jgi:hypothetical protein